MSKWIAGVGVLLVWATGCGGDDSTSSGSGSGGISGSAGGGGTSAAGSGGTAATSGSAGSGATGGSAGAGGDAGAGASGGSAGIGGQAGAAGSSGGAAGTAGGVGGTGGGDAGDTTPPSISNANPADGAKGVTATSNIVITFSEPMDQVSAQAAYQSADIPAAQAVFTWNAAGTVMTVNPNSNLTINSVNSPSGAAKSYSYTITTTAKDLAGNPLVSNYSAKFTTLRKITHTLSSPTANLTGFRFSTGGTNTSYINVGDTGSNTQMKGFVTFSTSSLAPGITSWISATLALSQSLSVGTPFGATNLGALRLYTIKYSAINAAAFTAPFSLYETVSSAGTTKNVNVLLTMHQVTSNNESSAQFRLEFTKITDGDGVADYVRFSNAPKLNVSYYAP